MGSLSTISTNMVMLLEGTPPHLLQRHLLARQPILPSHNRSRVIAHALHRTILGGEGALSFWDRSWNLPCVLPPWKVRFLKFLGS